MILLLLMLLFSAILCLLLHLLFRRRPSPLPLPPGPHGFPLVGALPLIGPKVLEGFAALSKSYGPLMYLKLGSQGTVIASSPAAARAFLTTADAHFANRPSVPSAVTMTYGCQNIIFSSYGPRWKLLRKLCVMHMVGGRPLADLAPIRRDEVGVLLRSLYGSSDTAVVVLDALTSTVGNIMGRAVLSRRLFDEPEFKDTMRELLTDDGLIFGLGDLMPVLAWIMDLLGLQKGMRRKHQRFDAMITQMLADHAASAHEREGRPDFIDLVMQNLTGSDGETLSDDNVKGLILDLFTAGTDPSKLVIEWALAEMVSNPEIMKRAQSEMDQVIGKDRRLEEGDLPSLPYLQAVSKEALRKHPPVALSIPRCSSEPCEVEGYYIPTNTQLLVNMWAMGRNPDLWEEPLEFRPERFLSGDPGGADKDFLLMPFGAGRRVCVGKPAAMLVVQYILGSLLHSFDWRLPEGEKEVDLQEEFGISLNMATPLKLVASPRLSPAAYT